MHELAFDHETELDAVFVCSKCGTPIGFNKSETSEPHAEQVAGTWVYPENPEQWMAPCNT